MTREETLTYYDEAIKRVEGLERKGKTMPYTSVNGYMFSQLNKDGEIGIRLSKEAQLAFKEKYNATHFLSYGAKMRDYVKIPESLYTNIDLLGDLISQSFDYTKTLPPK